MKKLLNLSLKFKLYMAFTVIFLLVVTLSFVSDFAMKDITKNYKEMINTHYQNIRDTEKLKTQMLTLRKHEKDFLMGRDIEFITKHAEAYKVLDTLMINLQNNLPESFTENIQLLLSNAQTYNNEFKNIVNNNAAEGNSTSGIRGDLRSSSHDIESFIKDNNLKDSYMVALLTFRRREKDFLLRRDAKYFSKLKADVEKVYTELDSSAFQKKGEFKALISGYVNKFKVLTENENKLVQIKESLEKNIEKVETVSNDLISKSLVLLEAEKAAVNQEVSLINKILIMLSFFVTAIVLVIGLFSRKLILNLIENVERLKSASTAFQKTSSTIVSSSVELKDLTTSQSSSIQETASSVNEITAMVSKNNKSAQSSQRKTEENSTAASKGKKTVEDVIRAMNNLLESSNLMNERFEKTSSELEDVVSIINQIGDKTKVINDIVFQTKLLSFNASVEAARAGENGKGFAVVAEEVGNLANMSGTSAEEITKILDESISKVTALVESNKQEMNQMIGQNNVNVNKGIDTAKDCEKVLNSIIKNVGDINVSISEIAHASKEQDVGVKEISEAINSLNDSNQKVTWLAGQSREHADSMEGGVKSVLSVAESIEEMVHGKGGKSFKQNESIENHDEDLQDESSLSSDTDRAA